MCFVRACLGTGPGPAPAWPARWLDSMVLSVYSLRVSGPVPLGSHQDLVKTSFVIGESKEEPPSTESPSPLGPFREETDERGVRRATSSRWRSTTSTSRRSCACATARGSPAPSRRRRAACCQRSKAGSVRRAWRARPFLRPSRARRRVGSRAPSTMCTSSSSPTPFVNAWRRSTPWQRRSSTSGSAMQSSRTSSACGRRASSG